MSKRNIGDSSPSCKSQTSQLSHTPLTFESRDDALDFIRILRQQLFLRQSEPLKILPGLKCFDPSDLRRFTYGLKPAVYN